MARIQISPAASITPTGSGVILNSDLGTFRLKGSDLSVFVEKMVPLLDGSKTREELADAIEGYSNASVIQLLSLLEERGLLEVLPDVGSVGPQERFSKVLPENFLQGLTKTKILIVGLEPWGVIAAQELAKTGVGTITLLDDRSVHPDDLLSHSSWKTDDIGQSRATVAAKYIAECAPETLVDYGPLAVSDEGKLEHVNDAYDIILTGLNVDDHFVLRAVTQFAHTHSIASLNGHLDGQEAWIGPVFLPGHSGCWDCYRLRKLGAASNQSAAHEFDADRITARAPQRARSMLAPMGAIAGQMMALDALRILGLEEGGNPAGKFRVMNLFTGEQENHSFVPMPWCETCGGAAQGIENMPPELRDPQSHVLSMVRDGKMLRDLMGGWVDPRAGVMKDLTLYSSGQDTKQPRTAGANVVGFTTGDFHAASGPLVGSGKSLTDLGAEIGALGESIERYSASRFRKSDMEYARLDQLNGDTLDPATLPHYSKKQYGDPHFPCQPWNPKQKIHWVKGTWMGGGDVWVPALPTYFNFFVPPAERFCQVSSNGLAAGGDRRDASVRAVYELLERDSFMLNWFAERPARRLVIDEALDPGLEVVMHQLTEQGAEVEFWVLDDLGTGIPTVVTLGHGDGHTWGGTTLGLSCHADIRVAAQKALLEQAHFGPYLARIMKESKIPQTAQEVMSLEDHALFYVPKAKGDAFDFMRSDTDPLPYSDTGDFGPKSDQDPYDYVASQTKAAGLKIATVDVTSPDVMFSPFRVARAIGEYVQPIHFGYQNRPMQNKRLEALLNGKRANPNPHPIA